MKAVRAGHYCTAKFLISKGANVNKATTNNDHTPLSLACAGGHLAIVELLLQNKADPYHKLKVCSFVKFMFSKKAKKIDKIFTVDLTVTTYCQIDGEDFVNFCGLLRKREL